MTDSILVVIAVIFIALGLLIWATLGAIKKAALRLKQIRKLSDDEDK